MRLFILIVLTILAMPMAMGQTYRPKPGETILKIQVEGRGDIFVRLHTKEAPKTTAHILKLVRSGFYDGQRFHRVERTPKPYLAQLGDPGSKTGDLSGKGGSGAHIEYEETGFSHDAGAVGLAHDVNDRNSGDSQFYMLLDRASFLNNNYTVFGRVVEGMDVLQKVQRGDRVMSISVVSG
jgi:cyclophilin family peptidyl-prolyl cis-trans isomerase